MVLSVLQYQTVYVTDGQTYGQTANFRTNQQEPSSYTPAGFGRFTKLRGQKLFNETIKKFFLQFSQLLNNVIKTL